MIERKSKNKLKHYTPQELSELIGGSDRFWRKHARYIIGTKKIGRLILIPEAGLTQFLEDHEIELAKKNLMGGIP